MITQQYLDELTYQIIGCAIEVHKELGPGLLESVYHRCIAHELNNRGLIVQAHLPAPISYKGYLIDTELRLDLLVEDLIAVELKSVLGIIPVYEAQLLTYMKLLEKPKGILINFNCCNIFHEGQRTYVNSLYSSLPKK